MKFIGGLLLAIVLLGGAYMLMQKDPAMQQVLGGTDTETPSDAKHTATWSFEPAGEQEVSNAPLTKITLTWDGGAYDAGTYAGQCAEIDGTSGGGIALLENEVSGAFCYWAGFGDEVGIFKEGDRYVLKHGEYQEPTAEAPDFRGNFTTLVELGK
jgi:hypothetical protein